MGSGDSISAISRSIGAERTSIHKALSDERVLPYKVVQNLARHFNLSLDERRNFYGFITYFFREKKLTGTARLSANC